MSNDKLIMWIGGGLFALLTIVGGWAYNGIDARIDANTSRTDATINRVDSYNERIDALMESLTEAQKDISYIRGVIETENRIKVRNE